MLDEPGTLRVARGLVKYAYHTAAVVRRCVIALDPATRRATLVGDVDTSDAFLLTQTPLVFVIPTARGASRWPIVSCQVVDHTFSAQLGALEGS